MRYEYKVVPAPTKGQKGKGIRSSEARFSNALEQTMNNLAADGWEYLRSETLPSEERAGLTSSTTKYRSVMVFRRSAADDTERFTPEALPAPMPPEPPVVSKTTPESEKEVSPKEAAATLAADTAETTSEDADEPKQSDTSRDRKGEADKP